MFTVQNTLYRAKPADISLFVSVFTPSFLYAKHVDLGSDDCRKKFLSWFNQLRLSEDTVTNLELGTRGQVINKNWAEARTFITASNMGQVCKRKKSEPDNLVSHLRNYKPVGSFIHSIQHGRRHEHRALKDYAKVHSRQCGENIEVQDRGLSVRSDIPYLGASVDGVVTCSTYVVMVWSKLNALMVPRTHLGVTCFLRIALQMAHFIVHMRMTV